MYAGTKIVLLITTIFLPVLILSCTDFPISVSNITNCVDGKCFYPQLAVTSMDLTDGQEMCMSFSSSTNTSDQFDLSFTVLESISMFPTTDCYYTDDPIFAVSLLCNCPLAGNPPATCPTAAHDTPFADNQFCIVSTAPASGCPFGRTSDYSAKIGVSALPRYRVCSVVKQPTVSIGLSIHDTKHNDTELVYLTSNNMFFSEPAGLYNFTITNINTDSNQPGDYQILDTSTNNIYYLNSDQCNSKFEDDPFKFGAIKINNDSSLIITERVKNSLSVQVTSCASDTGYVINPIPPLISTNTKVSRGEADDLPTLRTGLIWYNLLGKMNYIGLSEDYLPLVGAPFHIFEPEFVDFFNNPSAHAAFPGNTTVPYWNATECICYAIDSFTVGFITALWKHGWVRCPTVSYPVLINEFRDPVYGMHAACIGDAEIAAGSCPGNLVAPVYPDRYAPRQLCFSTDHWFINLASISQQRRSVEDDIIKPNYHANSLITVYYNSYSVSFETQTLQPIITDVDLDNINKVWTFKIKTLKSKGNCYVYSKPQLFDQTQVSLTQSLQSFEAQCYDQEYNGDVTIFVECGYSRTNKTVRVELQTHATISKPAVWFESVTSKPWFPYTTVSIGIAVSTALVVFIWKMLTRRKTPMKISPEEFRKRYR